MGALLHLVRFVTSAVTLFLVAMLLARFALESPTIAAFERFGLGAFLTQWIDPPVDQVATLFGIRDDGALMSLLPMAAAILLLVAQVFFNDFLIGTANRLERRRKGKSARAKAAENEAPIVMTAGPAPAPPGVSQNLPSQPMGETVMLKPAAPTAPPPQADATMLMAPARRAPDRKIEKIGRYEIIAELGRGAMGQVFKAKDPQIGRTVAIKTVLAQRADDPAVETFHKRFEIEARAAGRLSHPGIVSVHDVIVDEHGSPCQVLEFVDGDTLDRLVAKERFSISRSLVVVLQAAKALAYAHENGIVHRDIKPANIMLKKDGTAKISDFGIAKMDETDLTATGTIVGTPAYMSPEQCIGGKLDHRSDVFSLGAVLYWLVTGQRPFDGETMTTVVYKVVHADPELPSTLNSEISKDLERVLLHCLAKSPEARYRSAGDFAADLERLIAGKPLEDAEASAA